jgi:hypothetical protein
MSTAAAIEFRDAEDELLRRRVAAVCTTLNRAHAQLVQLTASLLSTEQWAEAGIRSPEHWLVVRAGLSPARAHDLVALARRAEELPEILDLLSDGRLGIDQATVVARYVPHAYAASVAELAEHATVPQLRRLLSRYQFSESEIAPDIGSAAAAARDPETEPTAGQGTGPGVEQSTGLGADQGAEAVARHLPDPDEHRPHLSMTTVDGQFRLSYTAPASLGALVEQAIRESKDALFASGATDATLADGLLRVAHRSLSTLAGTSRADLWRLYVHLDTDGGFLAHTGRLPQHMIARLTCDGVLQPVWETDGVPVSVGRASRIVPTRTRRLVLARDQGCRYPGCQVTGGHVEVHHLRHWRDGGATDIENLITLCGFHHDRHHEGAFSMTGSPHHPGTLRFRDQHGYALAPLTASSRHPRPSDLSASDLSAGHVPAIEERPPIWEGPTGERLESRWVTFTTHETFATHETVDEFHDEGGGQQAPPEELLWRSQ